METILPVNDTQTNYFNLARFDYLNFYKDIEREREREIGALIEQREDRNSLEEEQCNHTTPSMSLKETLR